jgi:multidrug efflux system membrane fusion protein
MVVTDGVDRLKDGAKVILPGAEPPAGGPPGGGRRGRRGPGASGSGANEAGANGKAPADGAARAGRRDSAAPAQ